jgi:hypothetical protein
MKERQDSLAARIAGTIAGGVRRRQQEREPRALVYDESGEPRVVAPGTEAHARLVETAEALVEIALNEGGPQRAEADGDVEPEPDGAERPGADESDARE